MRINTRTKIAAAAAFLGLAAVFGSTAAVAAGVPVEGIHTAALAAAPAGTPVEAIPVEIPHE